MRIQPGEGDMQNPAGIREDAGGAVGIELEASASLESIARLGEPGDRLPCSSSGCNSH